MCVFDKLLIPVRSEMIAVVSSSKDYNLCLVISVHNDYLGTQVFTYQVMVTRMVEGKFVFTMVTWAKCFEFIIAWYHNRGYTTLVTMGGLPKL